MVIPPFTSCPATGDAFIGRQGLVRNLRKRIARGESLAVIGGPKLGKTSLVRTALQGLTSHTVIEIDCGAEPSPRSDLVPGSIVVLDNLDSVADSAIESRLARVSAAQPASIVVTGGHRLRTMLGHSGTSAGRSFRAFPLSVLLDGETRRLIGRDTSAALAAWTGNHPYLTKLLLHYMGRGGDENTRTLEHAVATGRAQWEPFVQRLAAESGEGSERRLLCYLIEYGKPVNPTLARSDTGIRDMKTVADRLVSLGVISRWIRNEEATLFAGCRLLNDFITAEAKTPA
ncbi:MAG TPA: hypothetical protein VGQ07_00210 [Nitrospirales bacterium]|nr:hypothetical protein [Nitrospirales bacterium]